ncbi:hypothetical protein QBC38DRAFT_518617 [Podospora fimiseda]|uniref:Uncharacterized protein n=1 Tax=Podospora fimiseda TaxID=252190 RepID=A0AAN7BFU2_9PEZI|nr:hypothetical protein QBC38DRAFT_518617 [Podospora fimiseda]
MARLTELAMPVGVGEDSDSIYASSTTQENIATTSGTVLPRNANLDLFRYRNIAQQALQSVFCLLETQNYNINGTVVVPHIKASSPGDSFNCYPAKIQLDTGSDVDFVSLDFLNQTGFTVDALTSIPIEEQDSVMGIGNYTYTPTLESCSNGTRTPTANTKKPGSWLSKTQLLTFC